MPGKHLEYVKAGGFVIPVELNFIKSKIYDEKEKKEIITSKWLNSQDWKEIKKLLKPVIESCLKLNDELIRTDGLVKNYTVAYGSRVAFGYTIAATKEHSTFQVILEPRNCWTDDEDDVSVDEESQLGDYGGLFRNMQQSKVCIRAFVMKRSDSSLEDSKKLRKEFGTKVYDIRNYIAGEVLNNVLQDKEKLLNEVTDAKETKLNNSVSPAKSQKTLNTSSSDSEREDDCRHVYNHYYSSSDTTDDDFILPDIDRPLPELPHILTKNKKQRCRVYRKKQEKRGSLTNSKPSSTTPLSGESKSFESTLEKKRRRMASPKKQEKLVVNNDAQTQKTPPVLVDLFSNPSTKKKRKPSPEKKKISNNMLHPVETSKTFKQKKISSKDRKNDIPRLKFVPTSSTSRERIIPDPDMPVLERMDTKTKPFENKVEVDRANSEPKPASANADKVPTNDSSSDALLLNKALSIRDSMLMRLKIGKSFLKTVASTPGPVKKRKKSSLLISQVIARSRHERKRDIKKRQLEKIHIQDSESLVDITKNYKATEAMETGNAGKSMKKQKTKKSMKSKKLQETANLEKIHDVRELDSVKQPEQIHNGKELEKSQKNEGIKRNKKSKEIQQIRKAKAMKKIQEAEEKKKKLQEEEKTKQLLEEERKRKLQEEEKTRKLQEEENRRKLQEEKNRRKLQEEENRRKLQEEEKRRKLQEEEKKRRLQEEEKKKKLQEEEKKKKLQEEKRKKLLEEEKKRKLKEAEERKKLQEAEERKKLKEAEEQRKLEEAEKLKKIRETKIAKDIKKKEAIKSKNQQAKKAKVMASIKAKKLKKILDEKELKRANEDRAMKKINELKLINLRGIKEMKKMNSIRKITEPQAFESSKPAMQSTAVQCELPCQAITIACPDEIEQGMTSVSEIVHNENDFPPQPSNIYNADHRHLNGSNGFKRPSSDWSHSEEPKPKKRKVKSEIYIPAFGSPQGDDDESDEFSFDIDDADSCEVIQPAGYNDDLLNGNESDGMYASCFSIDSQQSHCTESMTYQTSISMPPPTRRPPRTPKKSLFQTPNCLSSPCNTDTIPNSNFSNHSNFGHPALCRSPMNPRLVEASKIQNSLNQTYREIEDSEKCDGHRSNFNKYSNKTSKFQIPLKDIPTSALVNDPEVFHHAFAYVNKIATRPSFNRFMGNKMDLKQEKMSQGLERDSQDRDNGRRSPDVIFLSERMARDEEETRLREEEEEIQKFLSLPVNVDPSTITCRRDSNPDGNEEAVNPEMDSDLECNETGPGGRGFQELLNRVNYNSFYDYHSQYQPRGDEFDMSQRSQCFRGVVPNYDKKSRLYKIHAKNIAEMCFGRFEELVMRTRPEIQAIYEGDLKCHRQDLYLKSCKTQDAQGVAFKKELQALSVTDPFHNNMTMVLIEHLFSHFFPKLEERIQYTEYMTYVLVPETLIRIYAIENRISYELAEKEMIYKGCYDGPAI